MKKIFILLTMLTMFCTLCACNSQETEEGTQIKEKITFDDRIDYIENLGFVTGPESPNGYMLEEAGVMGTDLGINFDFKGQTVFLYGDTFSGPNKSGMWNSNFLAITTDTNFDDGITFDSLSTNSRGLLKPIIQGNHDEDNKDDKTKEVTKIPTGAVTIGDTAYLFYMSIRSWFGETGWLVTYNQCIKSTDLENWEEVPGLRWNDEEAYNFGQIYPMDDPNSDYIYLYCLPGGRFDGLVCARVLETKFENKDEYEYQVANNNWVKGSEGLAMIKENPYFITGPYIGEPCVNYNPYLGKYMLTHMSDFRGYDTLMVLSDTPYGPFDDEILLYPNPSHQKYGVFTSPNLMKENGKVFYISVSNWELYNTYLFKVVLK